MGIIQNIQDRISGAKDKILKKVGRVTMVNSKSEPWSQLELLDADRLQMILRSAIGGGTRWLFALYRDMIITCAHMQAELGKRKLAVLGDVMNVVPLDKTNADDVAACVSAVRLAFVASVTCRRPPVSRQMRKLSTVPNAT